jgi:CheY-like chemotaxis protein
VGPGHASGRSLAVVLPGAAPSARAERVVCLGGLPYGTTMSNPPRVLIVDDNHLIRQLLGLLLAGAGYVPLEAESAEEALALASGDPPDAWIVDHEMPGTKGDALVRAIRAATDPRLAGAAVIGISAHPGAEWALRAAGASAFVSKPVKEQELLEVLARTLAEGGRPPTLPAA